MRSISSTAITSRRATGLRLVSTSSVSSRQARLASAVLVAVLGVLTGRAIGHAAVPRSIDRYGTYDLSMLGGRQVAIAGRALTHPTRVAWFTLPGGAREHAKHWYVLHLHASVTIAADSPPGRAYLVASTGSPAAEIRFDVRPDHVIKTTAVGFVDGTQSTVSRDRTIVVRFRNFIPYAGVSPGLNALEVGVQSFGAKIARVTVLGDTSIEYTPLGPANVKVHVSASPTAVVDRRLHITVRLTNTGDRVARELVLSTAFSGARAALVGSVDRPVPELRPGGSRAVGITYIPQAAGRTRYFFLVSSTEPSRHPA